MATIDPPRAIRVKTATGWAELVIQGANGQGVPTGGAAGNILTKTSATDYATSWQAPAASGSQITYRGDYNAATTYHDGDYVVGPDGVTYQCVQEGTVGVTPTPWASGQWGIPLPVVNGQWLKGVGGVAVWSAIADADLPVRLGAAGAAIPGGDFNNALLNGWYGSQPSDANNPNAGTYCMVHVLNLAPSHTRQVAYEYNSGAVWMRRRTTGAWGAWALVTPLTWLGPSIFDTGRVAHNTDFLWQWTHNMGRIAGVVAVRVVDAWYARNLTWATQEAPNYTNIIFTATGTQGDGAGQGTAYVTLGFQNP